MKSLTKDLLIRKNTSKLLIHTFLLTISSFAGAQSNQFPLDFQCAFKEAIQIPLKNQTKPTKLHSVFSTMITGGF